MDRRWNEYANALESGTSDRVNDALDDVEGLDLDERARLFDVGFDELTALYEDASDGYVRQATVRFAERLVPGLATAFTTRETDTAQDRVDELTTQTDRLAEFLLEAITDDDGRVRKSAKLALNDVYRTYNALDDTNAIAAVARELEDLADESEGKIQADVLDAKQEAEFTQRTGYAHLLGDLSDDGRFDMEL